MKRRSVKKHLREYERQLAAAVASCMSSLPRGPAGEQTAAARELLCAVNDVVYLSLMLDRAWPHRQRFLEYLDEEKLTRGRGEIRVRGRFIWWPERVKITEPWWPDDRTPDVSKYGGKYMSEPFAAALRLEGGGRPRLRYVFTFGAGKTARRFRNGRPTPLRKSRAA
ncbi:MAG TPA: hypothetical protein VGV38_01565 [Pyrinomonadaceae bacterium]|nr:hypothetical protein [Pyrinomonadaceae bacterium]